MSYIQIILTKTVFFLDYIDAVLANETAEVVAMEPGLTIENINGSYGGWYYCIISNPAGFDIVKITVFIRPFILQEPDNIEVESGTMVTANCEADGFPAPTYQWMYVRTGQLVTTDPLLELSVSADIGGEYQCVAASNDTNVGSDTASFTIYG